MSNNWKPTTGGLSKRPGIDVVIINYQHGERQFTPTDFNHFLELMVVANDGVTR